MSRRERQDWNFFDQKNENYPEFGGNELESQIILSVLNSVQRMLKSAGNSTKKIIKGRLSEMIRAIDQDLETNPRGIQKEENIDPYLLEAEELLTHLYHQLNLSRCIPQAMFKPQAQKISRAIKKIQERGLEEKMIKKLVIMDDLVSLELNHLKEYKSGRKTSVLYRCKVLARVLLKYDFILADIEEKDLRLDKAMTIIDKEVGIQAAKIENSFEEATKMRGVGKEDQNVIEFQERQKKDEPESELRKRGVVVVDSDLEDEDFCQDVLAFSIGTVGQNARKRKMYRRVRTSRRKMKNICQKKRFLRERVKSRFNSGDQMDSSDELQFS